MYYLDIISDFRKAFSHPIAAYHVSGEYAMIHAGAQAGVCSYEDVLLEALISIKRAGADIIFTYGALDAVSILRTFK